MKLTKPGFEAAYEPFKGYNFADAESALNAVLALQWAARVASTPKGQSFRPPAVIVTGAMGTGKTSLVHAIVGQVGEAVMFSATGTIAKEAVEWKELNCIAENGYRFLCFDNMVKARKSSILGGADIERFITSQEWTYRPIGTVRMQTYALASMLFFTGMRSEFKLSPDMKRRCVFIHLRMPAKA